MVNILGFASCTVSAATTPIYYSSLRGAQVIPKKMGMAVLQGEGQAEGRS